ncbi:MAG: porin PorA family protein, partial [Dehalococcoidia bacterium]
GLLQDPSFLAALGDPIAMAQLASHPVAGPLLADPDVLALLQDPAFQTLLQGGALVALASQPQLLGLLSDPSLGLVLANPAVQVLLADPEALSLVLDERTQLLLANPAVQELIADSEALSLVLDPRTQRLMANPADLPTIDGQVVIHRVRRATGTDGNRIFINEQKTYIDPTTGQELPGFPMEDNDLVVDRKSKEYLPGTAEGRTGFWGLPFDVDKNRPYNSWVTAAKQPQPAVYQGTEKLEGLETYLFVQDVNDLDLGLDPILGLPLVVDASIKAWVEPKTGAIVRIDDRDVVSALDSSRSKHTLVMFDVKHTEETVALLVDDTKDNRNKIVWFGSVMPWMSMGLGMFLAVAAGSLIGLTTRRKGLLDSAS